MGSRHPIFRISFAKGGILIDSLWQKRRYIESLPQKRNKSNLFCKREKTYRITFAKEKHIESLLQKRPDIFHQGCFLQKKLHKSHI